MSQTTTQYQAGKAAQRIIGRLGARTPAVAHRGRLRTSTADALASTRCQIVAHDAKVPHPKTNDEFTPTQKSLCAAPTGEDAACTRHVLGSFQIHYNRCSDYFFGKSHPTPKLSRRSRLAQRQQRLQETVPAHKNQHVWKCHFSELQCRGFVRGVLALSELWD